MKAKPLDPFASTLTAALCRRRQIRRLSLFGSAQRGAAGPDSDVDLLVEFEPGAGVQMLDPRTLAHRLGARADTRRPVDRDQAVRAVARAAQQPAPAVVLKAPREGALSRGI